MISENTSTDNPAANGGDPATEGPTLLETRIAAERFLSEIQAQEDAHAHWQHINRRVLMPGAALLVAIVLPLLYLLLNGTLRIPGLRHREQATVFPQSYKANGKLLYPSAPTLMPVAPALTTAQISHNKQVARDLQNYIQQGTRSATPDEAIAMNALSSVTGANFKSNALAFRTIQNTVLPHYSAFLTRLVSMRPQTPEVQSIHRLLLKSSRLKIMAFQHILEGLRETDNDQLWQYGVHAELDQATQFAQDYHTQITDLAAARGVKL